MKSKFGIAMKHSASFSNLPLRAHPLLQGVPLHDVYMTELPGTAKNINLHELRKEMLALRDLNTHWIVKGLFNLRWMLGRILGWDKPKTETHSYLLKLTDEDKRQSLVLPGTKNGPFQLLYCFANESLEEVINATVHAFSLMALEKSTTDYKFYWAIYVRKVSRWTPIYMTLIDPFRKWIIYPSILKNVRCCWVSLSQK